jgi:hypothetical protein
LRRCSGALHLGVGSGLSVTGSTAGTRAARVPFGVACKAGPCGEVFPPRATCLPSAAYIIGLGGRTEQARARGGMPVAAGGTPPVTARLLPLTRLRVSVFCWRANILGWDSGVLATAWSVTAAETTWALLIECRLQRDFGRLNTSPHFSQLFDPCHHNS